MSACLPSSANFYDDPIIMNKRMCEPILHKALRMAGKKWDEDQGYYSNRRRVVNLVDRFIPGFRDQSGIRLYAKIASERMRHLKDEIMSHKNEDYIVVVMHHPIFGCSLNHKLSAENDTNFVLNPLLKSYFDTMFASIASEGGHVPEIIFSAHDHKYFRSILKGKLCGVSYTTHYVVEGDGRASIEIGRPINDILNDCRRQGSSSPALNNAVVKEFKVDSEGIISDKDQVSITVMVLDENGLTYGTIQNDMCHMLLPVISIETGKESPNLGDLHNVKSNKE